MKSKFPKSKSKLKPTTDTTNTTNLTASSQGWAINTEWEGIVTGYQDGHGLVYVPHAPVTPTPAILLSGIQMEGVIHQDRVRVRIISIDRKGRATGRLMQWLERGLKTIVGQLQSDEKGFWVRPEDHRLPHKIRIASNTPPKQPKHLKGTRRHHPAQEDESMMVWHGSLGDNPYGQAKIGQIVVVQLDHEPPQKAIDDLYGHLIEVLGEADDAGMEVEIAVRQWHVPHRFSKATETMIQDWSETVHEADWQGRVDLRDIGLITIDGEDARDFDDAVYATSTRWQRRKAWRLLVAIADVSHYVQPQTPIDEDAITRSTSVYFPRRVIPMLPEKLSNGLCSLKPHVDRLCVVCDMVISMDGDVVAYQFYPAVMHSHARLTYTQAWQALNPTPEPETTQHGVTPESLEVLKTLYQVYDVLAKRRVVRGAIEFETIEAQCVFDEKGHIAHLIAKHRNHAHRLIEEAMLAANVCAADFIHGQEHLGLYRVHQGPTPERLKTLKDALKAFGVPHALGDAVTPQDLQQLSQATKTRPDAAQIHQLLLRSMQQATYTPDNHGHFGLAYAAYTHFTSPIRRYPDLLVHRVIKALLTPNGRGGYQQYVLAKPSSSLLTSTNLAPSIKEPIKGHAEALHQRWQALGQHCSMAERRADEASRDVLAWLKCRYMLKHLGDVFDGKISGVTSFGFFVTLTQEYLDGLVHISSLGNDYYVFDAVRHQLRGERTGKGFQLGDAVRIQVASVEEQTRRIDFVLHE